MSIEINETALMQRLAYPTEISRTTPEFGSLQVYCRGDETELASFLVDTPFELDDDLIMFSCTDKRSCEWFKDGVRLPIQGYLLAQASILVRYGDHVGSFNLAGYGNEWRNLMGTAEFLGETKRPANISLANTTHGVRAVVTGGVLGYGEGELLSFGLDASTPDDSQSGPEISWPSKYFTIRMVPSVANRNVEPGSSQGLSLLEIFALEGGTLVPSERITGDGYVNISSSVFEEKLGVKEVLGASFSKGHLHFDAGGYAFTALHQVVR